MSHQAQAERAHERRIQAHLKRRRRPYTGVATVPSNIFPATRFGGNHSSALRSPNPTHVGLTSVERGFLVGVVLSGLATFITEFFSVSALITILAGGLTFTFVLLFVVSLILNPRG